MMDDETRWHEAALPADQLVGPPRPESTPGYDDIETGIASIFAALQAAGDEEADHASSEGDIAFEEHTFQLLGELDRLWQRPAP